LSIKQIWNWGLPRLFVFSVPPLVYYFELKMAKNHPFIWGALVLGLTLGSLSAYENRPGPAGRSAPSTPFSDASMAYS
jgi:hypothetical protein